MASQFSHPSDLNCAGVWGGEGVDDVNYICDDVVSCIEALNYLSCLD